MNYIKIASYYAYLRLADCCKLRPMWWIRMFDSTYCTVPNNDDLGTEKHIELFGSPEIRHLFANGNVRVCELLSTLSTLSSLSMDKVDKVDKDKDDNKVVIIEYMDDGILKRLEISEKSEFPFDIIHF